jgi:hypothetical protein
LTTPSRPSVKPSDDRPRPEKVDHERVGRPYYYWIEDDEAQPPRTAPPLHQHPLR